MKKQRDLSIDFIKGVLIFLVVFGHCLNELHSAHSRGWADLWINSFHMPLFMFVSGWFACHSLNKGVREIVTNKTYRLALPALIWSSVIFLQRMVMGESPSLRLFYDSCRGMWFLWCLYAMFMLSALIWRCKHKVLFAAVIASSLLVLWPWYPNDLLKHFKIPLHFPIFFIGAYLGGRFKGILPPPITGLHRISSWGKLLAVSCCYVYFALQDHRNMQTEWAFLWLFTTYLTSVPVYFVVLRWIYGRCAQMPLSKCLCVLGNSTLGIYALNERIIVPLSHLGVFPLHHIVPVFLISMGVIVLCYGCTMIIRRFVCLKMLLGEK